MDKFKGLRIAKTDHSNIFMGLFDNMKVEFSNSAFILKTGQFKVKSPS